MGLPIDNMAGAAQNGANGGPSSYAAKFNLAPHFIGGNHLQAAAPGKVKDFVTAHDGHTVITNVRRHARNWTVGVLGC
jgi:acetyl-CoA carboxylase/biotin carboxylase 1